MKLSNRLKEITDFVDEGSRIADIGTDHGYVPVSLARAGRIQSAVAMDLRKGPLERAKAHVAEYGLETIIDLRLSDGLEKLHIGEADTIIIAGMGGSLVVKILAARLDILADVKHLVLSPQSELEKVRMFLQQVDLTIIQEKMVYEDGKYYTIMKTAKGQMDYGRYIDFRFGKLLMEQKDEVLKNYLAKEQSALEKLLVNLNALESEKADQRKAEVLKELEAIKEAKDEML